MSAPHLQRLFEPVTIGALKAKNRFVMAAMTRNRGFTPLPINVEYYTQRASAGLILSEGTLVELQGSEWPYAPGIWRQDQIDGWKSVTDSVHKAGSLIVCQLWHLGRVLHPLHQGGKPALGPSPIAAKGGKFRLLKDEPGYVQPLQIENPEYFVQLFKQAAINAKEAGFDGVQLHSANGYLSHEFLDPSSNQRTDMWGGSVENRARFTLRCIDELIDVWGADRVGIKVTPAGGYNDMGFEKSATIAQFTYLIEELNKRQIAFMEFGRWTAAFDPQSRGTKDLDVVTELAPLFKGTIIVNGNYDEKTGSEAIAEGKAHAISYGRPYLANPDLPHRYQHGIKLNDPDYPTFYNHPEGKPFKGYTDYKFADDKENVGTGQFASALDKLAGTKN